MILRELKPSDEQAFKRAVYEFRKHQPDWQFAFYFNDNQPFNEYVSLVKSWSQGENLNGFVPNTYLIAVINDLVVGRISIRHKLNDYLFYENGGHIGYGVVPSCRKKGYASQMLKLSLPIARSLGLTEVLLTTDHDNFASIKTIEKNGGLLEANDTLTRADKLRYWIKL